MLSRFLDKTFLKFILVGAINTLFGTVIMFGFYNVLHLNYWISSAANYFWGSVLSYFLNKHFTFQNKEKGWKPIVRFSINISLCYFIAYGIAKPLVTKILADGTKTFRENVAMLVGMCLFVGLNYLGQRFFAFKEDKSEETSEKII